MKSEIAILMLLAGCAVNPGSAGLPPAKTSPAPVQIQSRSGAIEPPPIFSLPIYWDYDSNCLSKVAFDVETKPDLAQPWTQIGTTTNLAFTNMTTNAIQYYRVGAHWRTNSWN
jgi:hypothetical protein